ncbi:hypothetical protein HZC53_01830 [Candidatus Uhrbacteria bacterium]|nr:hypothetical protein [Candidatus Uhrbacteria bacterium]
MFTRKFDASGIHGTRTKGDKTAFRTYWWNRPLLSFFSWRRVTLYMIPEGVGPYRVGYKLPDGTALIHEAVLKGPRVAVRRHHEDIVSFAVGLDGREIIMLEMEDTYDDMLPACVPSL